ncbi:MAG: SpoVG family protein [Candidatus Cloacimonetes bacterium]|nr:SpoVG family protein [Candidatus Cloacimonadota bacterium]
MKITEVRITLRDEPKLKAFVDVVFDNAFVIHGMKVIKGRNDLFVAMPNKKGRDGSFRDIAHPINNEMRVELESAILNAYEMKLRKE